MSWIWPRQGYFSLESRKGTQPGRLTPPGQTEPGIPYHVPPCWVPLGGELWGGNSLTARKGAAAVRFGRAVLFCGLCSVSFCCVFSLSVSLLFLFPLFAIVLNCPYPDSPVSACFFPFPSAPRWREVQPRGAFVADRRQTITNVL